MSSSYYEEPVRIGSSNSPPLITPRPPITSTDDILIGYSPETPLYTPYQRRTFTKEKQALEMEVATLEQKKKTLIKELRRVKDSKVPESEVFLLKAQTTYNITDKNASNIEKLMIEYAQVTHDVGLAKSTIEALESQIKEEYSRRQEILNEVSYITQALDLSDHQFIFPTFNKNENNIDANNINIDIERKENKVKEIQSQINDLLLVKSPPELLNSAASEYSRSLEKQWETRSIGSGILRTQIQTLQKLVTESDSLLRKDESETEKQRNILSTFKTQSSKEIQDLFSNNLIAVQSFKSQILELEATTNKLLNSIASSTTINDAIQSEIEQIESENIRSSFSGSISTISEAEIYDEDESISTISANENIENTLRVEKEKLEKEIKDLREKYGKEKLKMIKREKLIKKQMAKLYAEYSIHKRFMETATMTSIELSESPLVGRIGNLISRIDNSLLEMREEFVR